MSDYCTKCTNKRKQIIHKQYSDITTAEILLPWLSNILYFNKLSGCEYVL